MLRFPHELYCLGVFVVRGSEGIFVFIVRHLLIVFTTHMWLGTGGKMQLAYQGLAQSRGRSLATVVSP